MPTRPSLALVALALLAGCLPQPAARQAPPPRRAQPPAAATAAKPPLAAPPSDAEVLRARRLVIPVAGVTRDRIPDTFDAPRAGGRRHNATDIMARRGTPVLAADDGRVISMRRNPSGGITLYATDEEARFVYYYAHLSGYREGVREGTKLAKGDVIGYVGTSGNAPENAPHLHFQLMRMPADGKYWAGAPIDARPFLVETVQAGADRR